ncbi:MAG: 50S ribosomal protein L21 [Candidatus Dormibacteria bacterium]
MYAILQHGGHQYRVASGDRILVDRIPVEVGSTVTLESVLLLGDGAESDVAKGSPLQASVTATVIAHRRGRKIRVFTYKPKKRHRRTLGYRSQLTELLIDEVGRGKAETRPKAAAPKRAAAPKAASKPDPIEAKAEAIATEAEAVAVAAEEAVAELAVAEEAVDEAIAADTEAAVAEKPAAPKRARTPKPKKDPGDGA